MADVTLEVTIKDQYVQRVLDALNYGDGKTIDFSIISEGLGVRYGFSYTYTKGGANNKVFGEKFLKAFMVAFARCYEFGVDNDRYSTDISNVTKPTQSVPDEIVE